MLGARGRRAAAILAAAVTVTVAGCGGISAGAASGLTSQPVRRQLSQALRIWSGFPVGAPTRPLVLAGPQVDDPASGFPDGTTKLAYIEGAFDRPATMPAGPATAAGYRLIGAYQAFRVLKSAAGKGPTVTVRLKVTMVRLGSGVFQTDRGIRRLPAWLFGFAGVPHPAAVLAVAPAGIFAQSGQVAGRNPFIGYARLGRDGRTLTLWFTGAAAGTGPCTADYSPAIAVSRTAVAVAVRERAHGSGNEMCSTVGYARHVTTTLPTPLGARVVIDAASDAAIAVIQAAPAG